MTNLLVNSDNTVILSSLYDSVAAAYVNGATVTGQLLTNAGVAIAGSSFSLTYVAASNGNYRGVLTHAVTAALVPGTSYVIEVTAVSGSFQIVFRQQHTAGYP